MKNVINVKVANTFVKKLIGLMFKKDCSYNLMFEGTSAIHTFFMRFPIDCLCLDKNNKLITIIKNIKPWRVVFAPSKTKSIVELKSDNINLESFKIGQVVTIHKNN